VILEAIEWLITPCPPWARRYGYLAESIAIRHRARRCAAHWAAHQANTRNAILRGAGTAPARDHAVILGAGPCLDVPVGDLADLFGEVTLVDAVRPRGLRLPRNVRYRMMDVHGAIDALASGRPDRGAPLDALAPSDLTVSVNLLSQLPRLPLRALRKRSRIDAANAARVSARIMTEHVRDLSTRTGARLMISDAEHRLHRPDGSVATANDIAGQAGLPAPLETWIWPVAPPGERGDGLVEETTVGVWVL
jgi:hypothetical protein